MKKTIILLILLTSCTQYPAMLPPAPSLSSLPDEPKSINYTASSSAGKTDTHTAFDAYNIGMTLLASAFILVPFIVDACINGNITTGLKAGCIGIGAYIGVQTILHQIYYNPPHIILV